MDFFKANYKRGGIALIGGTDFVSKAIREAESTFTPDKKPSKWSHALLFGDMRPDHNDESGRSIYIFESTINVTVKRLEVKNGAQENWVGVHDGPDIEHICTIDFYPTKVDEILATALQLVDDQMAYPIEGLLGYWLDIVLHKLWKQNPLESIHAMVCSQYVRYCYSMSGEDFMGSDIAISNTAPEHIYQAGQKIGHVVEWSLV